MNHPKQIQNYKVTRVLGNGSMGVVYLAERNDGEFHKKVAIKFIRVDRHNSQDTIARFKSEQKILAALEHENIARLIDAGYDEQTDSPFLIMEYVDGLPISEYCKSKQLSIPDRLKLFGQVCNALEYAHQNLVIHRDIKPSNILVNSEGLVKVLDFGIAKILDESQDLDLTQLSHTPFTPKYASPEQVCNQHLTTASDVFSFGVLLFELLTDCPMYRHTTSNYELAKMIQEEDPSNPSTVVKSLTSFDDTVIDEAENNSQVLQQRVKQLSKQLKGDLDKITLSKRYKKTPVIGMRRLVSFKKISNGMLKAFPF